jgi:putative endonuclease
VMFFCYILYSLSADRYYVGSCADISLRLARHNRGGVPSTKPYQPWILVYEESFSSRAEAEKREKEIKLKKSRNYLERLVESADTSRHLSRDDT